jgi:MoxR-like ATPase
MKRSAITWCTSFSPRAPGEVWAGTRAPHRIRREPARDDQSHARRESVGSASGPQLRDPGRYKAIGPDVLRHRIILTYEAEAEAKTTDNIVRTVFDHVPVP